MLLLLAVVLVLTISRETDSHKCNGGDFCCSWTNICDNGEGDCDLDSQCRGRLKCGDNNCAGLTFDTTDDCCWDAGVVFQALSLPDIFLKHPFKSLTILERMQGRR